MHFTIWTENRPNKGEDAIPSLLINAGSTKGMLAVYDGLGGAGSKVYEYEDEQGQVKQHSGAYLASRLAKKITENYFNTSILNEDVATFSAETLKDELNAVFAENIKVLDKNPSKLRSKLIRRLPTTIAGLYYETKNQDTLQLTCFWAGDSRAYVMSATGLKQLSIDDLNGNPDALENLTMDATISNCIDAEGRYQLHSYTFTAHEPVMLITATDGCFGYVKSPTHFEYLLLKALMQSQYDIEDWKERLEDALLTIAGDDVSLSILLLGLKTLEDWKIYFYERFKYIQSEYILPLDEAEANIEQLAKQQGFLPVKIEELEEQKRTLREQLWEKYKVNYYTTHPKKTTPQ
ncbi:MAG TPA: hypothetical protein DCS93_17915 [Microscillaceae bacterium]|nr:hypothetical protein [Microscillaceae bacterium]